MRLVIKTPRLSRAAKSRLRWSVFNIALIFFFADFIAAIWPAFDAVWRGVAHLGVSMATILAAIAEFISAVEDGEVKRALEEHQKAAAANDVDPIWDFDAPEEGAK